MPRKPALPAKRPLLRAASRPARNKVRNNNNQASPTKSFGDTNQALADQVPFWRNLEFITQYQKQIWGNLTPSWWDAWQQMFRLAPSRLTQSILPWSFSAFQFTNEIQGNPDVEYKILTQVAGYGSQLGTIMDFLEVLAKRIHPDLTSGQTNPDLYKVLKFYDLLKKIDAAKGRSPDT
jgi:hypothetical protein